LVIIGNHKPKLVNVDDAMRRRLHIIPFVCKPAQPDKHLEDKLRSEYPQILNWMIEGYSDWKANGLVVPEVVRSATDEYFANQDFFGQWLNERCVCGKGETKASSLYGSWQFYAEQYGEKAGSLPLFAENLSRRGFEKRKTREGNVYRGIALKSYGSSSMS